MGPTQTKMDKVFYLWHVSHDMILLLRLLDVSSRPGVGVCLYSFIF